MNRSVELAAKARRMVMRTKDGTGRKLLIAGSIGPYGACQCDGSEYEGTYGRQLGEFKLFEWHKPRFDTLCNNKEVDLLAIETIPCLTEVKALITLLQTRPEVKAWMSVSCSSEKTLCSGESFEDFVRIVEQTDIYGQIDAIGMNCSDPQIVPGLLSTVKKHSNRPFVVYPNNGDIWDAQRKEWIKVSDGGDHH